MLKSYLSRDVIVKKLQCLRCGNEWYPRIKKDGIVTSPKNCPKCFSPYWYKPIQRKSVSESRKNK